MKGRKSCLQAKLARLTITETRPSLNGHAQTRLWRETGEVWRQFPLQILVSTLQQQLQRLKTFFTFSMDKQHPAEVEDFAHSAWMASVK